jgi:hypothetical protein
MQNFRIGIIPFEARRIRNKSFILIRVAIRNTQDGQMGAQQPPFIQASTWLKMEMGLKN